MLSCHYCARTDRELRPYGPGGSYVCKPCVDESEERTEMARRTFLGLIDANEAISPSGAVVIGGTNGPQPFDPRAL